MKTAKEVEAMLANDVDEIQDDSFNSTAIVTPHPNPPHHKRQPSWDEIIVQNFDRILFSEISEGINLVSLLAILAMAFIAFKIILWVVSKVKSYLLIKQAERIKKSRSSLKFNYPQPQGIDSDLLLRMDVKDIRHAIIDGQYTCEQVVTVFAHRCFSLGRCLNITGQEGFNSAIQMAKEKDKQLKKAVENDTVDQLGPFFGVPIAVGDEVNWNTYASSFGLIS